MFDFEAFAIISGVVLAAASVEAFIAYRRAWRRYETRPVKRDSVQTAVARMSSIDDQAPYGTGTSLHG
jgi:hypothetical protein|tara:strand:- start:297 stop:500 length:204 start_codon:yes stop_codon:yes gene_type:complete